MARLDIGGTQIEVSDDFLKLSPQDQDAFVHNTIVPSAEFQAAQKTKPTETAAPDDHGLARRQKMSQAELAVSPFTEYPRNYEEMRTEAERQMGRGVQQLGEAVSAAKPLYEPGGAASLWEGAKGVGNIGLGALGYLFSPGLAAYRSIAGQPIEDVTGIPREYTEFTAQLATPGIGLTSLAKAPGAVAEAAAVPRGFRTGPEPGALPPIAEAAQRQDIAVPRAVSSESRTIQGSGQAMSKIPIAGEPVAQAVEEVGPQLGARRAAVAEEFGGGTAPNAAHAIRQELQGQAAQEAQAAQAEATAADQAALAQWQRTQQEQQAAIASREQQAAQAAQGAVGPDVAPLDMGDTVIGNVRANERAAFNRKNAAYEDAGSREGTVFDDAVGNADRSINAALAGEVTIRPRLTPAASEMQRSLQQFSNRARARVAAAEQEALQAGGRAEDAAQTGLNLRQIETQRKELNRMANSATSDEDARAARHIIEQFDEWQHRAMQHSFDGDPGALDAYLNARALNRDWRQRFGYNQRDDADKLINKIVRGQEDQHTGPVAVSDALMAQNDKSGPLVTRVLEATGNDPNTLQAIRSGTWNKLSRDLEGAKNPRAPDAIRQDIYRHLYGKGRDVAERVFTQEQRDLMRAHADTLFEGAAQRETVAAEAKATQPVPTKVEPGPIQQLADRVIGGNKSDEALFQTIMRHATSKNAPDIKTLAEITRRIPSEMKGDFVHNLILNLGKSAKNPTEFSPAVFAREWESMTPQAKAVLFGMEGNHIQALNDIASISRRMEQVQSKFGNPSGTGFVTNFSRGLGAVVGAITAGHFVEPMHMLGTAVATAVPAGATYGLSRFLASPIGASSAARFARATERLNSNPNMANAAAARLALRNVVNTARSFNPPSQKQERFAPNR